MATKPNKNRYIPNFVKFEQLVEEPDKDEDAVLAHEIPSFGGLFVGPGQKMFKVVSRYSTGVDAVCVPDVRETTIFDVKSEIARVLMLPQNRQELLYGGMPMQDEWSIMDLPKDCEVFYVRVQTDHDWMKPDTSNARYLPKEERLPNRTRNEMELETQGKWDMFTGAATTGVDTSTVAGATLEAQKHELHDRVYHELKCFWFEAKFNAEIDMLDDRVKMHSDFKKLCEVLVKQNADLRSEYNEKGKVLSQQVRMGIDTKDETDSDEEADEEEIDIDTLSEAEQEKLMMKRYRKQTMARKLQTSVRTFISDFATFIYFCLLFTIVAFTSRGDLQELYLFGRTVEATFYTETFKAVGNNGDVWNYIRGDLFNAAYQRSWYNGDIFSPHDYGNVQLFNRFVGSIQFRQVRGPRGRCNNLIEGIFIYPCFNYDGKEVNKESRVYKTSAGAYLSVPYKDAAQLGTASYSGKVASYPGGGQTIQVNPTNITQAREALDTLFENRWLDEQTRALFIDFTTYNGNINKFCNIRIVFEMPSYGGVHPTLKYAALKLYRYLWKWS